jgi:hypothetical protein
MSFLSLALSLDEPTPELRLLTGSFDAGVPSKEVRS